MKNIKKILLSLMVTVTMMLSLATTSVFAASGFIELVPTNELSNLETGKTYNASNQYIVATLEETNNQQDVPGQLNRAKHRLASGTIPTGMELKTYVDSDKLARFTLEGIPTVPGTYKFSFGYVLDESWPQPDQVKEFTVVVKEGKPAVKAAFTSGANATWNKGSTKSVTFKVNTTMDDVVAFKVDGKALDMKYIELDDKTGSLIITMKPAYLQGLSVGKHKLEVVYSDTVVATNFTVKAGGPKTSDTTNAVYVMGMLGISALAAYFVRKKKEN